MFSERLSTLLNSMELPDTHELLSLITVAQYATHVSTYLKGFTIIIEPYDESSPDFWDPWMTFACLDPSIAMKDILGRFKSVVLTSGTMSPMEMYTKILDFKPTFMKSIDITLRNCISPLMITRGFDGVRSL
jgi:DNA excision repair protein ERCC-2